MGPRHTFNGLVLRYIYGFVLAFVLSVAAFIVATEGALDKGGAMGTLLALAVIQLVVQLVCFLHLGRDRKSADRSMVLLFTAVMALIIIIGSIWVMRNLDYRMGTTPENALEYMIKENKKGF